MRTIQYLILLLSAVTANAQKQNNNWCFGNQAGVTFNTVPPSGFSSGINTLEPQATVSDRQTGDLLFYCNSYTIWDASHSVMQNGVGIGTDSTTQSSSQGANIVPMPGNANRYYVFTTSTWGEGSGNLCYSIVDMTLNGGLGAVVAGHKRVLIDTSFTEGMAIIPGCNKVWLLVQRRETGDFYAYPVTETGIGAPVVSQVNLPRAPKGMSHFKVSPDGTKLMDIGNFISPVAHLVMHNFSTATGRVSGTSVIQTTDVEDYLDMEFSPDGKRLYIASGYRGVYQFDMTLTNPQSILNSKKPVVQNATGYFTGIANAANGKMYSIRNGNSVLDEITSPNAPVPGCTYVYNAVPIWGTPRYNLPAKVVYPDMVQNVVISNKYDKTLCAGDMLSLQPMSQGDDYRWQDGDTTRVHNITKGGKYYVEMIQGKDCSLIVDTFIVEEASVSADIFGDTMLCVGDTLLLKGFVTPTTSNILWSTGSTTDTTKVIQGGNYTLVATYKGCADTASIGVNEYPIAKIELGNDTILCSGDKLRLPLELQPTDYDKYIWQDGSTANSFIVKGPGRYYIRLENICQSLTDSIYVTERDCHFFFPSAFTPNNDGLNDFAKLVGDVSVVTDYTLKIVNRWGQEVFKTQDPSKGWDGMFVGKNADIGTYFYLIDFKYLDEPYLMKGSLELIR